MPVYLDDPSVLTKDKLKSELMAHNVELPGGNPTKDVYVQLYLKNLTAQNLQHGGAVSLDAFSSDEELPPVVISSRSRSSGRKAVRKTDKVRAVELDVTELTDEGLKDELLKLGADVGPIVASTRKVYEKKLQKLLDNGPTQVTQLVVTEIQVNHNGNSESDLYSDKEDEVIPEPEPEPITQIEPEPVPVVERPLRSRGKTPVTTRSSSSKHKVRNQEMDEEDEENSVLNVRRRSRRLSSRPIVPEELRPVLADQVQLQTKRRVSQRLDSPARSVPPSISSRPAQLQEEEPVLHLLKPSKDSPLKAAALLDTTLLEEPERIPAGSGSAVRSKSVREEQRPRPAAHPLRPSSPLVHLTNMDQVTFSPMCHISPIMRRESYWSQSDQCGSKPRRGEERADAVLQKLKQQKISDVLSSHGAVRTLGSVRQQVEKIAASEPPPKEEESIVLKELFPNDINSPTGITATCRRPIRGAAGRPLKSSDLWNDENSIFSPKTTKTSSSSSYFTESHIVNRVSSLPLSSSSASASSFTSSSSSRPLAAAPPAAQTKAASRGMALWKKLILLAVVAAFLFLVYQAMETTSTAPFKSQDAEVASGSTA
ncbi:thymopoietin a isoform X2 [Notolabrus celidotus]|uniref:thymopoietin a isoform X2 n=1 Tax=Notolabrus celidotus TaxID=1203425 RepID=UPI00148F882F|nr:thymopoietin a isoform X2 [Notolabrus celidotus]